MSIIGKQYQTFDNSYSLCLSSDVYSQMDEPLFAACPANNMTATITTIVSEPYMAPIIKKRTFYLDNGNKVVVNEVSNYIFVNVKYDEHIYRVLYNDKGVNPKLYYPDRS